MSASILPSGQFNPASLGASGAYISIVTPPGNVVGVPTDVIGVVGTASWGPVNAPSLLGSMQQAQLTFGPITAAALNPTYGVFDLPSDLANAFLQASSQASLQAWGVRVTDGTDTAANVALAGGATATGETATVAGTVATGDTIALTATSSSITGSPVTVTYTLSATDTAATAAAGLAALLNANQSLSAARVAALASGAVISLYAPSGVTVVWTEAVSGAVTLTLGSAAAATAGASVGAMFTGSGGNNVSVVVAPGSITATSTVTVLPPFGGVAEVFTNLPNAGFWQALVNALNNGISTGRGPSHIVKGLAGVNNAVGAPTPGTYALSGGTDGRNVDTAQMLGSQSVQPMTGFYALTDLKPGVRIAWIAGTTDPTLPTTLAAWGESQGCKIGFPFPTGTATSTAIASRQSIGVSDTAMDYLTDWIYFADRVNSVVRLVPPTAFWGGAWATYRPSESPDNKPVYGVLGTERNPPGGGGLPYTNAEIGQLQAAGITVITNPIPAGPQWGIRGGRSTSANSATVPSEYWRMTGFITSSIAGFAGLYVSQLQSQQPNDPLRAKLRHALNTFFNGLYGAGLIDSLGGTAGNAAQIICDFSKSGVAGFGINTPASIGQHYLYLMVKVRYLSSAWWIIMAVEGGTTVVSVVHA